MQQICAEPGQQPLRFCSPTMVLQTTFNNEIQLCEVSPICLQMVKDTETIVIAHMTKEQNCKLAQRSNTEKFSATPVSLDDTAEMRQLVTQQLDEFMLADKIALAEIEEHSMSLKCDMTNAETSKTTAIPNGNYCNADIDASPLQ